MQCPKCSSTNVNVQIVNELYQKNKHHSALWWLLIGWWWLPVKWICFFFWALIAKILGYLFHTRKKIVNVSVSKAVCQNCGYTWTVHRE